MSLKEQAEALGIKVDGRWSDKRIQEEIDKTSMQHHRSANIGGVDIDSTREVTTEIVAAVIGHTQSDMNNLAMRIWEGQSISLPEKERVTRIIKALREKGYEDLSDLDLPVDMSRYI